MITFLLVLSATKLARDCLKKNETGNGRTLSLQALCNDGSINACTLMLDDSYTAMNTILKINNSRFSEQLMAWLLYLNCNSSKKSSLYFFNGSESSNLFKIFVTDDLDHDLFLAVKKCLK